MQRVLLSLVLLALSSSVGAEGLVQITLEGTLQTVGGARIEFEVGARANGEARQVILGLHLAENTTCSDLATLLSKRLESGGFEVLTTRSDEGGSPRVQIFVEDAIFVRMRLGGGGMGVVYEARDEKLGRRVALKVMRGDQRFFEGSRERFTREIRAASRLDHPHV